MEFSLIIFSFIKIVAYIFCMDGFERFLPPLFWLILLETMLVIQMYFEIGLCEQIEFLHFAAFAGIFTWLGFTVGIVFLVSKEDLPDEKTSG